jgi:hypothetical protein
MQENEQKYAWSPDPHDIENAARICHEANRVICAINGDLSQPTWEDAPDWQKESAREGVRFHLQKRHADGRDSHDKWMETKLLSGWRYGPTKDAAAKTHPCLLPYHALPDREKVKDDVFRAIVRGYFDRKH